MMFNLSKYKDNPGSVPVKIKTSSFGNLERTCSQIEEIFRNIKRIKKMLNFRRRWFKNGEYIT